MNWHSVYTLHDQLDEVVYVGVTAHLDNRFRDHQSRHGDRIQRYEVIGRHTHRADAFAHEARAIATRRPALNVAHNPDATRATPATEVGAVGRRLREARVRKGLSLTDIADAMSDAGHPVTRQAVSLWEHDTWPNWKNMRTLAGILGVHPSDIWPFTNDGEEEQ